MMRLTTLPSEFQEALPILEKIKKAGFEAYFVGGSVRDAILGRPIHDVDIATSSYPEETKTIFPKTIDVGIEHGTVLVLTGGREYEITTFRTEDVYVDFRRPSAVHFVRSLEEDLKRRDFTVNAFALDEEANVIDLFDGLTDLEEKRLRAVGQASERFNEDALRIMRGFRFVASLGFDIEEQTFAAMADYAHLLEEISVERSFIEFDKLLMAFFWQKGLELLVDSGAQHYLPGLKDKALAIQSFCQSLASDFQFGSSEQAWAGLLYALSITDIKGFLKAWKTSSQFQKDVDKLVQILRIREQRELTKRDCYRFGADFLKAVEELRAGQGLSVDFNHIDQLDQTLTIHSKQEMAVTGRTLMVELGLKAGPHLGDLLHTIEMAIVDGQLDNNQEAIFEFIAERVVDE
ncbi:tRNA nucleotidyltransferase [Streptococcus merionis]|uniref:CCA-adding enzyme n=2 Tax=Streptococcus merionis TaxID=400065 RepID=A0A239SRV7_9STRE|nr:tRNA nucleotidyltransferase [Streptococcus merionis]